MDIYFCDLCGVRVTDIDLKGGHGLRSGHDVICATCLELGHGKEWLAKRQAQLKPVPGPGSSRQGKAAVAVSAASAASAVGGDSRQSAAALLDRARDRARTAEEDQTPAVGVQVLASESDGEEELVHAGESELEADSGAHAELKAVENQSTNLAAAANSFSALSASTATRDKHASHHADDLDDQETAEADDQADAPTVADGAAIDAGEAATDGEAASDSPFSFKGAASKKAAASEDADERKVNQKDETLPTDRPPIKVEAKSPSSITSSTKRSSAKNSKAKSPKASGRGGARPAKKSNNRTVIILSCITLPFLLIMIYLTVMRPAGHGPQKKITVNISEELRHSISEARQDATAALQPPADNPAKLDAALDKIQAIRPKIDDFESLAKKAGMTEDDIIRAIEAVHWQDTAALIRNLHDAKSKLQSH